MKFLPRFFDKKKTSPAHGDAFSDFVTNAPSKEKRKVLKEIVKKANEDQRELMKRSRV